MYRINVLTKGENHQVTTGYRYCLRKKTAKNLIKFFSIKLGCQIKVEKFIRIHSDLFSWVDDDYKDSVFDYYEKVVCGEEF